MEFDKSKWADTDFSRDYLDKAEIYIVERSRMFSIVKSFYQHFVNHGKPVNLLELGSGDGALTHELLRAGSAARAVVVDGSMDMLNKAEARMREFDVQFVHCSFEEFIREERLPGGFDMVVSSLAIHHLTMDEKSALFNKIYQTLTTGGYFVNIDVVIAPSDSIENWYMEIWKDWMRAKQAALGVNGPVENIIERYKDLEENKPDTLDCQLGMLKNAGFKEIDCYYKYGIFTIFGGRK
ncbi:methyltransferase domain-containing protein [Candidatus Magnetominusculus dajiuhuensis]|uniref:methyltransferase domain-containing protein n=1 Tax=Candidatus Magnetominusculus dajiuhuensis TaxID=3137712 RepID=UPI003B43C122